MIRRDSPPDRVRKVAPGTIPDPPTAGKNNGAWLEPAHIGLGLPYNISVAALDTLTQGASGYLLITGSLTTDQRTRLSKYFLQVLAGVTNAGAEYRLPCHVTEADYSLNAFVLSLVPQAIDYQLEGGKGAASTRSIWSAVCAGYAPTTARRRANASVKARTPSASDQPLKKACVPPRASLSFLYRLVQLNLIGDL